MTSDRAGDPISKEPVGSNSVSAASSVGSHDRLNEAPQVIDYLNHVKEECISHQNFDDARILVQAIKIILRDGQPG